MGIKNECLGVHITNQSREIINNMIEFVTEEHKEGAFLVPVGMLQKRVAAMTGVSERSIQRIASESRKVKRGKYHMK